jgi:DNA polymerase I-like protein with 3'-5' exonuclease and polymerase domains
MEKVHQLKVPLIVDVNFGDNWQDIQPLVAN